MVQEPTSVRWTTAPFGVTVHGPVAAKLTARPESAVALTGKSGSPKVFVARGPKVMVWLALVTEPFTQLSASPNTEAVNISAQLRQAPALAPTALMVMVLV